MRFLFFLLLAASAFGQDADFELPDMSGGLNLKGRPNAIADNEGLVCQNFIFDRTGGLLTRPGFSKVNSAIIDASAIWELYHYSIPNYGKGFLVGDSVFIYNMTDGGTFADSQIYFPVAARLPVGDSIAEVTEPTSKWLLEKNIFPGDEVLLNDGTDKETLVVKYLFYDSDSSRYRIRFNGTSSVAIAPASSGRSYARNTGFSAGSFLQRNNTILIGVNSHPALRWSKILKDAIGVYSQGTVNSIEGLGGTGVDTAVNCTGCSFSSNELAGKIFMGYGKHNTNAMWEVLYRIINGNTATKIYWTESDTQHASTGSYSIQTNTPFLIWSPVFTVLDSGIIDTVFKGTSAEQGMTFLSDVSANKDFSEDEVYGGKIIEFLDGKAAGVQRVVMSTTVPTATLRIYRRSAGNAYNDTETPRRGDRYVIYNVGLAAKIMELYYDRVVAAGMDFFPNTVIFSQSGDINNIPSGTNFITLPEQGGDSIVSIKSLSGNLGVLQKQRLWTFIGQPPWSGDDIVLAADGVGCVARNTVVKQGVFLYFVGLWGNIPSVYRWNGGGVKFTAAAGGNIFDGEGSLVRLTEKIDPFMMKVNKNALGAASAGIYGENLVVSLPFGSSTTNDTTICINLSTGAISTWTIKAGLWHNGRAAGDTGQVYFTAPTAGTVFAFAAPSDSLDTAQSFTSIFQSKWFEMGKPTVFKQGLRLWAGFFRPNALGAGRWFTRLDYGATNADTFLVSTTTGEREENRYLKVDNFAKRFGFRFEGDGVRSSFRLNGLRMQYSVRGRGL